MKAMKPGGDAGFFVADFAAGIVRILRC